MSLYQCEKCGCVENTAKGFYHWRNAPSLALPEFLGKKLCSACGPVVHPDGSPTGLGKWHGIFEQRFYPLGSLYTDSQGNVRNKETNEYPKPEDRVSQ